MVSNKYHQKQLQYAVDTRLNIGESVSDQVWNAARMGVLRNNQNVFRWDTGFGVSQLIRQEINAVRHNPLSLNPD